MRARKHRRKNRRATAKSKGVRSHAKRRFDERAGVELTRELHDEIVRSIQKGEAAFVRRQSNRVTLWNVIIEGKERTVVYDKKRSNITTVLYKEKEYTHE